MHDPYADFTEHTLGNGLRVYHLFVDRPWLKMAFVIHSGGGEDPVEMPGLAHFVEHAVSKNIPGIPYDKADDFFESVGGEAKFGSTDFVTTRYKFTIPTGIETLRTALDIFGSMLFIAQLKDNIERERSVIHREFNKRYPFGEQLEWEMDARKQLFRGHRLETWNRPLGRPEGFLATTQSELQGFYDKHYTPANMSVVVAGGISAEEILRELERSPFGVTKAGKRKLIPQAFLDFPVPEEKSRVVKLSDHVNFKVDQTHYQATWAFPINFPTRAFGIFDDILCKILFEEIRQKRGLAYSIGSSRSLYGDITEFEIGGDISPKATLEIDDLVRACINQVTQRPDLFNLMRRSAIQKCKMYDQAVGDIVRDVTNDLATFQRIITIQEIWEDLNKVRPEQMAEAVCSLSPERQYTMIMCP